MSTPLEIFEAEYRHIEACQGDEEVAHGKEDALHVAVLEFIEKHSTDAVAREAARIALKSRALDFARWCS